MSDYAHEHGVRELARKLFVEHNRANGALYPDGFGFLSPTDRAPWLEKARAQIGAAPANNFTANIEARISIINQMIPSAKPKERRTLQKERSDLELKLSKVTA